MDNNAYYKSTVVHRSVVPSVKIQRLPSRHEAFHKNVGLMLSHIFDIGPKLNQHCLNALCLLAFNNFSLIIPFFKHLYEPCFSNISTIDPAWANVSCYCTTAATPMAMTYSVMSVLRFASITWLHRPSKFSRFRATSS